MKKIKSSKLAILQIGTQRNLLHATLASAIVIAGSIAQTSTVKAQTQYCEPGNVSIPLNKICAAGIETTVNGIAVPFILNATAYDAATDQVEYNLLNPILITIPGSDGDRVTLNSVTVLLDPVLEFDASFEDLGEPSPFNLTFTSFPFAPKIEVNSSLSGSLTDGSVPPDGVSLTTTGGLLTYNFLDATDNVVDSFNLGSSVSFPAGNPGSYPYEPLSAKNSLTCDTDGCGRVRLSLAFTGSGGGDQYDFNSRSEITVPVAASVPEPSATFSILLFGLAGLRRLKKHLR